MFSPKANPARDFTRLVSRSGREYKLRVMKVSVFKPTNDLIGQFDIDDLQSLWPGLARFAPQNGVKEYDYVECEGRLWTIIMGERGYELHDGRVYPPMPDEPPAPPPALPDPVPELPPEPADVVTLLTRRYKDAYSHANAVVLAGHLIKALGIAVGLMVVLGSLITVASGPFGNGLMVVAGVVSGALSVIPFYVLGIIVAALGQTQLATLDTAVNSSRHLSDDEVAALLTKKWSL